MKAPRMPTHHTNPVLTCDGCGATRARPARGPGLERYKAEMRAFLESGWRMTQNPYEQPLRLLAHTSLVSCPDCPQVEPGDPEGVYRSVGEIGFAHAGTEPQNAPSLDSARH